MYRGNFLIALAPLFRLIHAVCAIPTGSVTAPVPVGLDVLGNADANRHWPHRNRADGSHVSGICTVRDCAPGAPKTLGLVKGNTNSNGTEGDTLGDDLSLTAVRAKED